MRVVLMREMKNLDFLWIFKESKWFVSDDFVEQCRFPFPKDSIGSTDYDRKYLLDGEYRLSKKYNKNESFFNKIKRQIPEIDNENSYSCTVLLKLDIPNDLEYRKEKSAIYFKNQNMQGLYNRRQLIFLKNENEWKEEYLLNEIREWVKEDNAAQVQSTLCQALREFKECFEKKTEEEKRKNLEEIQDILTFKKNPEDAYSRKDVQQYYMLKYGYMYILKYYMMYKELLNFQRDYFLSEGINVLSLGCGAKLDGMGMKMAIETDAPECRYSYTGVDYSGWNLHGYDFKIGAQDFERSDVIAFLKKQITLNQNVYIFPTSISEFAKLGILEQIANLLIEKIQNDHFYIMTDIRYKDDIKSDDDRIDVKNIAKIRELFENSKKFELVGEPIELIELDDDSDPNKKRIADKKDEIEEEYLKRFHAISIIGQIEDYLVEITKRYAEEYHVMKNVENANFYIMEFKKIK